MYTHTYQFSKVFCSMYYIYMYTYVHMHIYIYTRRYTYITYIDRHLFPGIDQGLLHELQNPRNFRVSGNLGLVELPRCESGAHLDGATLGPPPLLSQHGGERCCFRGFFFGEMGLTWWMMVNIFWLIWLNRLIDISMVFMIQFWWLMMVFYG